MSKIQIQIPFGMLARQFQKLARLWQVGMPK